MGELKPKDYLRKALPYLVVFMVIVIGIQAWCLAQMYQQQKQNQPNQIGNSLFQGLSPGQKDQRDLPLWPDDPWDDSFFSGPFDPNVWDPFKEMQAMRDRMNGMFGDAFGRFSQSPDFSDLLGSSRFTPHIDVQDEGDRFVIKIDLPGADNSNVDVSCRDQQVTISGTINQMQEEKSGGSLLRQERRSGRFSRSIPLPVPVQTDQMETSFDKGILTVTIPKA